MVSRSSRCIEPQFYTRYAEFAITNRWSARLKQYPGGIPASATLLPNVSACIDAHSLLLRSLSLRDRLSNIQPFHKIFVNNGSSAPLN